VNLANNLSLLRVLLAPAFVMCLVYSTPDRFYLHDLALGIFVAACVTDALDGWLARRMNELTEFGSYIDPIADKLLLLSGFLSLSFIGHLPEAMRIPAWVTIPVIARDFVILIGSIMIYVTTGHLKAEPLLISKATTVLQMTSLTAALLPAPVGVRYSLYGATVFLTVLSGVQYVRLGGKLLQP
jgi:cardiolipin synthase